MSTLAEIEVALSALDPEELRHVEEMVHQLRKRGSHGAEIARLERRNGFDPLPERSAAVVTVEVVRQLCADEGI